MNEIIAAYFDPDELAHIEQKVQDTIVIYTHMEWEQPFTYDELHNWACETIYSLRADPTYESVLRWRIQIQYMEYAEHEWEWLINL